MQQNAMTSGRRILIFSGRACRIPRQASGHSIPRSRVRRPEFQGPRSQNSSVPASPEYHHLLHAPEFHHPKPGGTFHNRAPPAQMTKFWGVPKMMIFCGCRKLWNSAEAGSYEISEVLSPEVLKFCTPGQRILEFGGLGS